MELCSLSLLILGPIEVILLWTVNCEVKITQGSKKIHFVSARHPLPEVKGFALLCALYPYHRELTFSEAAVLIRVQRKKNSICLYSSIKKYCRKWILHIGDQMSCTSYRYMGSVEIRCNCSNSHEYTCLFVKAFILIWFLASLGFRIQIRRTRLPILTNFIE